jgi:hypothetical protein
MIHIGKFSWYMGKPGVANKTKSLKFLWSIRYSKQSINYLTLK